MSLVTGCSEELVIRATSNCVADGVSGKQHNCNEEMDNPEVRRKSSTAAPETAPLPTNTAAFIFSIQPPIERQYGWTVYNSNKLEARHQIN